MAQPVASVNGLIPITFLNPQIQAALPNAAKRMLAIVNPVLGEIRGAGESWISQERLARLCGVTERTIRNWERRLEEIGVFCIDRVQGTNRRITLGSVLAGVVSLTGKLRTAIRQSFPVRAIRHLKDRARAVREEDQKKGALPQALRPQETKMDATEREVWKLREAEAAAARKLELDRDTESRRLEQAEYLKARGVSSWIDLAFTPRPQAAQDPRRAT